MKSDVALYSWCFTNVNENDATLRVLADGRVTVKGSELVEIPWPVMQALVAYYSRPEVQALVAAHSGVAEVPDGSRPR